LHPLKTNTFARRTLATTRANQDLKRANLINTTQRLAAQARAEREKFPQRAGLLAVESWNASNRNNLPEYTALQSIRDALSACQGYGLHGTGRIVLSPDSHWLIRGGPKGTVLRYDLTRLDAEPCTSLRGHTDRLTAAVVSPDSRWLITASRDKTVRRWALTAADPSTTSVVIWVSGEDPDLQISRDSRWLVMTIDNAVVIWDIIADPSQAPVVIPTPGRRAVVSVTSDSRWLIIGGADTVRLRKLGAPDSYGKIVVLPRRNASAATASLIGQEATPLEFVERLPKSFFKRTWSGWRDSSSMTYLDWMNTPSVSPYGRWLVTIDPGAVSLWDLAAADPSQAPVVIPTSGEDRKLAISPDGHRLVIASRDGAIRVCDITAGGPSRSPVMIPTSGENIEFSISPNSHWLVTNDSEGVRLWDLSAADPSRSPIAIPTSGEATQLSISPSGHWLVTASADSIDLWDLSAADPAAGAGSIVTKNWDARISPLLFSPDERWLVGERHESWLWAVDLSSPNPAASLITLRGCERYVFEVGCSPDGRWLIATDSSGGDWLGAPGTYSTARLWDMTAPDPSTRSVLWRSDAWGRSINDVSVSFDGRWLAAGEYEGPTLVWDLTLPNPVRPSFVLAGAQGDVRRAIRPVSQELLTVGKDGIPRLWRLATAGTASSPVALQPPPFRSTIVRNTIAISADGRWLAKEHPEGAVALWDLSSPSERQAPWVLSGHRESVRFAFCPNNRWLLTAGRDGAARLWDLGSPDPTRAPLTLARPENQVEAIAMSRDGRWLAIGERTVNGKGNDRSAIWLYDMSLSNINQRRFALDADTGPIRVAEFSPDGRWLVTGGASVQIRGEPETASRRQTDAAVRLWDLTAPDPSKTARALEGHTVRVDKLAISPDGRWLVTASGGVPGPIWDRTARLWDLASPDPARSSIALRGHDNTINTLAMSPDSHWLASGGDDHTIRLWDLRVRDPSTTSIVLEHHKQTISHLAFSPDGGWLITSAYDGTLHLIPLHTEALLDQARRATGRNLDPDEHRLYLPDHPDETTFPQFPTPTDEQ
jgi:WD40 repeat protein